MIIEMMTMLLTSMIKIIMKPTTIQVMIILRLMEMIMMIITVL